MDLAIGSDGYHPTEIDLFFAFRNIFFATFDARSVASQRIPDNT